MHHRGKQLVFLFKSSRLLPLLIPVFIFTSIQAFAGAERPLLERLISAFERPTGSFIAKSPEVRLMLENLGVKTPRELALKLEELSMSSVQKEMLHRITLYEDTIAEIRFGRHGRDVTKSIESLTRHEEEMLLRFMRQNDHRATWNIQHWDDFANAEMNEAIFAARKERFLSSPGRQAVSSFETSMSTTRQLEVATRNLENSILTDLSSFFGKMRRCLRQYKPRSFSEHHERFYKLSVWYAEIFMLQSILKKTGRAAYEQEYKEENGVRQANGKYLDENGEKIQVPDTGFLVNVQYGIKNPAWVDITLGTLMNFGSTKMQMKVLNHDRSFFKNFLPYAGVKSGWNVVDGLVYFSIPIKDKHAGDPFSNLRKNQAFEKIKLNLGMNWGITSAKSIMAFFMYHGSICLAERGKLKFGSKNFGINAVDKGYILYRMADNYIMNDVYYHLWGKNIRPDVDETASIEELSEDKDTFVQVPIEEDTAYSK